MNIDQRININELLSKAAKQDNKTTYKTWFENCVAERDFNSDEGLYYAIMGVYNTDMRGEMVCPLFTNVFNRHDSSWSKF